MNDTISRQAAIAEFSCCELTPDCGIDANYDIDFLEQLPSAQPEIIRCKDCKNNPKDAWFGCPMAHLSEKQRPEDAWCWKAERRTDD